MSKGSPGESLFGEGIRILPFFMKSGYILDAFLGLFEHSIG